MLTIIVIVAPSKAICWGFLSRLPLIRRALPSPNAYLESIGCEILNEIIGDPGWGGINLSFGYQIDAFARDDTYYREKLMQALGPQYNLPTTGSVLFSRVALLGLFGDPFDRTFKTLVDFMGRMRFEFYMYPNKVPDVVESADAHQAIYTFRILLHSDKSFYPIGPIGSRLSVKDVYEDYLQSVHKKILHRIDNNDEFCSFHSFAYYVEVHYKDSPFDYRGQVERLYSALPTEYLIRMETVPMFRKLQAIAFYKIATDQGYLQQALLYANAEDFQDFVKAFFNEGNQSLFLVFSVLAKSLEGMKITLYTLYHREVLTEGTGPEAFEFLNQEWSFHVCPITDIEGQTDTSDYPIET